MQQGTRLNLVVAAIIGGLACGAYATADGSADDPSFVQAARMLYEDGQAQLPPGTTVDALEWVENVLEIYLTIPVSAGEWRLSDAEMEGLGAALGDLLLGDSAFGGTRIRVRADVDQPYGSLSQFALDPWSPAVAEEPTEIPIPIEQVVPAPGAARGPVTQAVRQPVGALTGVTVFTSAGHGWTAGASSWALQRPLVWTMIEDYGNIDQLNYFAHYAFNAGATVVPFRPVGWQPIEIVLDNDDPGVTYTGTWTNGSSSKYYENGVTNSGVVYRWTSAGLTETATARYTPTITVTDTYPVYCFTIASSNRTLQTYRIQHSGGLSAVAVDHRLVGNGWVWLGNYYLEAGGDNYVEITNESTATGVIVADAIRWGSGMGDIVRPGPGQISGFPRDEECSRYWAESELGNHAVGFDSEIWDSAGSDDNGDNVRTAAKWAREMNVEPVGGVLVDRWKRVYLEFHTNASTGTARGQICLITDLGATTYQTQYATTLSNEVDADLLVLDDTFEHTWIDRTSATYTGSYGAICTPANGDEFDATIVELAFHDNQLDAELLRDDRVRAAMANTCVQGIIRFLNSLSGSQVPLAFLPDTPRTVRAVDAGNGDVVISWLAPLSDAARGDPATGYVVYQSANGYGFGDPIVLGNVLTTTVSGLAVGETRYFRVAATNAGGESMPSEVLAVRRPAQGTADVLIVNGFDRQRRQINPLLTFTQPPAYAGDTIERQVWSRSNAYDYIVQHAEALADAGYGFASCANEAITSGYVMLGDYEFVVWILGTESTEDATFSTLEQTAVTDYLNGGGALFVSGAELAYDLINQVHGVTFAQDMLRVGFSNDDANTYNVTGAAGGIFSDLGAFNFNPASGACYDVRSPDVLTVRPDAAACVNYVGGTGGVAGVQYGNGVYNVVTLGFPFETISSSAVRSQVMQRVMDFLATPHGPLPFDFDDDYDVDFDDFNIFLWCFQGPGLEYTSGHMCLEMDGDGDMDVDQLDFALFQQAYTGAP